MVFLMTLVKSIRIVSSSVSFSNTHRTDSGHQHHDGTLDAPLAQLNHARPPVTAALLHCTSARLPVSLSSCWLRRIRRTAALH